MVYGKGDLLDEFLGDGVKYNKKTMVMMENASNFKLVKPKLSKKGKDSLEESTDAVEEESSDDEELVVPVTKRPKKTVPRDDSLESESDLFRMGASAIAVRTPGS